MSQKRRNLKKKNKQNPQRAGKRRQNLSSSPSLTKEVLTYVFTNKEPVTIRQITSGLKTTAAGNKEIENEVIELVRKGDLISAGKKRYQVDNRGNIFSGRLEKNPRGFGFVANLEPRTTAQYLSKDPFLSVNRIGSANHGDLLLIRILRVRRDQRPEAEIISILERNSETISGFFQQGKPPHVIPEDPRYPHTVQITEVPKEKPNNGDAVIVQIIPDSAGGGRLFGRVLEVLGPADSIDVQMRMVIEKHNLSNLFPAAIEKETEKLSITPGDIENRLDLRNILHVTIDGETAKDFDDAICVEKRQNGYRLYVSIADVSHFVQPGTELDKEAYSRGTSIYFPGRVIPMLPEKLSNDLCSLVPGEDRLTFTAILDLDNKGKITHKKFSKSVICSKQRFTYTTVKEILIDRKEETRTQHNEFLTMLKWAKELANILLRRRMKRGSIGFNIPEPEISLEEDGRIKSIIRKERNFAHQIIEEFMLAANEAVAEEFSNNKLTFIYRIHEEPSLLKVEEFTSFAKSLGLELPPPGQKPEPAWFAQVLAIVQGSPKEYVVNNLLLRTMQQARYNPLNAGHFGLAATDYTHFTSPIRRYPDLMVHRFLNAYLQKSDTSPAKGGTPLSEQSEHLSSRERLAIDAERDIGDRLKVFFMEQFIGESFGAVISGVNENLIFIELTDLFISGAIDISTLDDDYYLFDKKRYRFIGEISGRAYQLGDEIEVTVSDVDHRRKRINFLCGKN